MAAARGDCWAAGTCTCPPHPMPCSLSFPGPGQELSHGLCLSLSFPFWDGSLWRSPEGAHTWAAPATPSCRSCPFSISRWAGFPGEPCSEGVSPCTSRGSCVDQDSGARTWGQAAHLEPELWSPHQPCTPTGRGTWGAGVCRGRPAMRKHAERGAPACWL